MSDHTVLHTTDGPFVFGANCHGQLGLGDRIDRLEPTKLLGDYDIIVPNKRQIKSTNSLFQQ